MLSLARAPFTGCLPPPSNGNLDRLQVMRDRLLISRLCERKSFSRLSSRFYSYHRKRESPLIVFRGLQWEQSINFSTYDNRNMTSQAFHIEPINRFAGANAGIRRPKVCKHLNCLSLFCTVAGAKVDSLFPPGASENGQKTFAPTIVISR